MKKNFINEDSLKDATAKVLNSVRACVNEYDAIKKADRAKKLQTLKPGETVPTAGSFGGFFDAGNLAAYDAKAKAYTAEIDDVLGNLAARLNAYKAEAPSEEDLRAVTALRMLKNPDAALIDAVRSEHGQAYLTSKIIEDIGTENGLQYGKHWADAAEGQLNSLANLAEQLAPGNVDGLTEGKLAFVESMNGLSSAE